jgi:hypothetical protein
MQTIGILRKFCFEFKSAKDSGALQTQKMCFFFIIKWNIQFPFTSGAALKWCSREGCESEREYVSFHGYPSSIE